MTDQTPDALAIFGYTISKAYRTNLQVVATPYAPYHTDVKLVLLAPTQYSTGRYQI